MDFIEVSQAEIAGVGVIRSVNAGEILQQLAGAKVQQ